MEYNYLAKKLREKLIMTQEELVNFSDVSFASINRWVTGKHEATFKVKRKKVELCKKNDIDWEDKENGN